jgi:hypothetical protein
VCVCERERESERERAEKELRKRERGRERVSQTHASHLVQSVSRSFAEYFACYVLLDTAQAKPAAAPDSRCQFLNF